MAAATTAAATAATAAAAAATAAAARPEPEPARRVFMLSGFGRSEKESIRNKLVEMGARVRDSDRWVADVTHLVLAQVLSPSSPPAPRTRAPPSPRLRALDARVAILQHAGKERKPFVQS